ncbi:hypothetical protein BJ170DRAFT_643341 [Xylariales sp. AK1849]|nr:hypothetical protein BJ170DRAFT_643341 [Xylariales sp. AK1849]
MEKSNQGPWQQLDPAKLKLEAERKEAKLKRQQEQRIIRAAERKEKRQLKSEAKQARKANVRRAGKWTEERRAEDKIKKALNKPHKEEKRYRRLLSRADRLEVQALTLMKQAQQARARYAVMTEQRAKVAAEKDKELNEIMNPEGGNFIEVPEVEGEKASGDVEMTNGTHDSEAAQHVEPVEEPVEELAEDKKSSKKPKKSKSKKDKPSEPENAISEIIAEASTAAQEEPKDIGTEDFIALEDEDKSKEKKKKKKKSKSDEAATDEVNGETSTATEKKVEKKRKREAGVDAETEAVATTNGIEDASETPKEKKHKKKKAKKADAGTEGGM